MYYIIDFNIKYRVDLQCIKKIDVTKNFFFIERVKYYPNSQNHDHFKHGVIKNRENSQNPVYTIETDGNSGK